MQGLLFRIRDEAKRRGVSFADIRVVEKEVTTIEMEDGRVNKVLKNITFGTGVRILLEGAWGFASTNSIDEYQLNRCLDEAIGMAKASRNYLDTIGEVAKIEPVVDKVSVRPKIDPRGVPIEEKIKRVMKYERDARGVDNRLVNTRFLYTDEYQKEIVCNTFGTFLENEITRTKTLAFVVAKEGNVRQQGFSFAGRVGGFEVIEELKSEDFGIRAAKDAVELLKAEPAKAGKFPVVVDNSIVGLFAHEAFGHNAEADLVQSGGSILKGKLGQRIASPLVTIIDDATLENTHGYYLYDSEGVPGQRTILVENGILKGFMHNLETASKQGVKPTGNGRAQDHQHRPIVRMSNTYIAPGELTFEELLRDIDEGVYVQGFGGGYVYPERGQYTCSARRAWMIRNGELREPLRDVRISGMTLETLMNIDGVSKDFNIKEPGTCGKDGQAVPVDNGGPFVRVKEMVVGGLR